MPIKVTVMSLDFEAMESPKTALFEKSELRIGRAPDNDLVLEREEVSGRHALLKLRNGDSDPALFVIDTNSSNGTSIENNPLMPNEEYAIGAHERIIIGTYILKAQIVDGETQIVDGENGAHEVFDEDWNHDGNTLSSTSEIPSFDIQVPEDQVRIDSSHESDEDSYRGPKTGKVLQPADIDPEDEFDETVELSEETIIAEAPISSSADWEDEEGDGDGDSSEDEPAKINEKWVAGDLESEEQDDQEEIYAEAEVDQEELQQSQAEEDNDQETEVEGMQEQEPDSTVEVQSETATASNSPSTEHVMEINFQAIQLFGLCGTITSGGNPLSDVTVNAGQLGEQITGSDGTFSFVDIEEGAAYTLNLSRDGYRIEPADIEGVMDSDKNIEVEATRLITVTGRVIHNGIPLAGVTIDAGVLGTTLTDDDGVYRFEDVPEDTEVSVVASKDGFKLSNL